MKKIYLLFVLATTQFTAYAQLVAGSTGSDFTFTDIAGTPHHLYDYLDQGKTVFIDVSTAWCPPCWNYHRSHALRDLYEKHGPTGSPGVATTTTGDVVVLFVEAELSNTGAQITGTVAGSGHSGDTRGDWTAGTPYPIIDLPGDATGLGFISDYQIEHYPTVIKICPNRQIMLVEQWPGDVLYQSAYSCSAPSQEVDVVALQYTGTDAGCSGNYFPQVKIQNNGSSPLHHVSISVLSGDTVLSTGTYSVALDTYETTEVTCSPIAGFAGGPVEIIVTADADTHAANGILEKVFSAPPLVPYAVTVRVYTDSEPEETTWEIRNGANQVVASGGPYQYGNSNIVSPDALTLKTHEVILPDVSDCYSVHVMDFGGDGMLKGENPAGYCRLEVVAWGESKYILPCTFYFVEAIGQGAFYTDATSGLTGMEAAGFSLYPNPASDDLTVALMADDPDFTITITDLQGRVLIHSAYAGLSGKQVVTLPIDAVSAGNYLVRVMANGFSYLKTIVIQ